MYDSIIKYMKKYESMLAESISGDEKILAKLPEGKLICNKSRNYYTWYRRIETDGEINRELIPKKNRRLAENLAMRAYTEHKITTKQKQLKAVRMFLRNFPSQAPGTGYLEECEEHKKLLNSKFTKTKYTKEQLDWMLQKPDHPSGYSNERTIPTILDYCVASKSESEYVSALVERGIVFRYEWPLYIEETGKYIYPDFTIIDPITGETIYLEHFGIMDDREYVKRNAKKLYYYFKNGIYPGKNLFCSYETNENKFTTIDAANVIDNLFGHNK